MLRPNQARHPPGMHSAEAVVLTKAVSRTAEHLALTNAVLARVLGLSEATVSRLRTGKYILKMGDKETELALLLVRLYRGLDAIVGGDGEAGRSWLCSHNLALNGTPLNLIQSINGITAVVMYVDAQRARI